MVQALLVVDGLLLLHAHQDLVGPGVLLIQIVAIIGGDERDAGLPAEVDELPVDLLLLREAIGLQLEEEIAAAEDVVEFARYRLPGLGAPAHAGLRHLPTEASRQPDQSLAMLAQQLLVDARVVIEALQVAHRVQVGQVLPADVVLGQEDQVVALSLGPIVAIGRDVGLAAEDGLDPVLARALVEIEGPEQVAVVGDGHGLHAALEHAGEELVQPDRAIEEAVLGMQMQMGELSHAPSIAGNRVEAKEIDASIYLARYLARVLPASGYFQPTSSM